MTQTDNNNIKLLQFVNCRILRDHRLIKEDFWVRSGKIVNPEIIFFDEKLKADTVIDCQGQIISPGFIELQINGGFGIDFSYNIDNVEDGIRKVAEGLLSHGVTSFCPTIVTSSPQTYHKILPKIPRNRGGKHGATVLGIHVEGPFINLEKKGAHNPNLIGELDQGVETLEAIYGPGLNNVSIVTLAPEKKNSLSVIRELTSRGIVVSLGHSQCDLSGAEEAVRCGANLMTHLFNAMLPFHHRDPGLVGLLASDNIPKKRSIYYGIISDGVHTNPAALRIAHRVNSKGLILVTDAIAALGLPDGTKQRIGEMRIEVRDRKAYIEGTDTLCGSIANMNQCVKIFLQATECPIDYALEAATLHPAKALGLEKVKGTLDFGADADFILLDEELNVTATWIAGECVYNKCQSNK